jgi:hypothetical protein
MRATSFHGIKGKASAGKVIAAAAAGGWPALLSVSNHHVKEAMMRL